MFQREMFEIKCSDCGKTDRVSFEPSVGKPYYCKTCFSKYTSRRTENVWKDPSSDVKLAWARRAREKAAKEERRKNLLTLSSSTSA
jgi:CxxC-x17-CxxC domain-containing protein